MKTQLLILLIIFPFTNELKSQSKDDLKSTITKVVSQNKALEVKLLESKEKVIQLSNENKVMKSKIEKLEDKIFNLSGDLEIDREKKIFYKSISKEYQFEIDSLKKLLYKLEINNEYPNEKEVIESEKLSKVVKDSKSLPGMKEIHYPEESSGDLEFFARYSYKLSDFDQEYYKYKKTDTIIMVTALELKKRHFYLNDTSKIGVCSDMIGKKYQADSFSPYGTYNVDVFIEIELDKSILDSSDIKEALMVSLLKFRGMERLDDKYYVRLKDISTIDDSDRYK